MAVSVPASPSVLAYFNTEHYQSKLFPDDCGSIGLYTTFGENDSTSSFGSWPDPYSCSEVSSFPAADSLHSLLNSPAVAVDAAVAAEHEPQLQLPSEEDLNLDVGGTSELATEFLQQFRGCHPNTPGTLRSNFADTLTRMMTPDCSVEEYIAPENHFSPPQPAEVAPENHFSPHQPEDVAVQNLYSPLQPEDVVPQNLYSPVQQPEEGAPQNPFPPLPENHARRSRRRRWGTDMMEHSPGGGVEAAVEAGSEHVEARVESGEYVEIPDIFQFANDEDAVVSSPEVDEYEGADGVHIPPPLNRKRIEMHDDAYYESIEAAEVPLDVIENKRPFQCGLAGCNKTFKNPQTMKMHHKTHFSDGSALSALNGEVDAQLLPTLTASASGGSVASWAQGRNKKIPSRCPKCRKTFVGLYELRRHYGRKHSEGERPFQCRKCDKRFYIEVDVRDHEKLCGEQVECKCGLKFAFKCNMVAHKKAHPHCQESRQEAPISPNSTSVTINSSSTISTSSGSYGPSTISDEDSSRSRWISPALRPRGPKRCHELVEASRPDLMQANKRACAWRGASPAQSLEGPSEQEDATSFPAPDLDFAGLNNFLFSPSNVQHYPTVPQWPVPGPVQETAYSSVFGGLEHLGNQIQQSQQQQQNALGLLQLAGLTPGL